MNISSLMVTQISKGKPPADHVSDFILGVNDYAETIDLDPPHRLAQFVPQIMHESGGLKWKAEIWGPTAQQLRYERDFGQAWSRDNQRNRVAFNLGNTERGDGSRFRGYGFIQTTGRANVTAFFRWCDEHRLAPPDFVKEPQRIGTAPWSVISALWFWDTRKLNALADQGETELITIRINGGRNGLEDRFSYAARTALVFLGYGPTAVAEFQRDHQLQADGVVGPRTRSAMHQALVALSREVA